MKKMKKLFAVVLSLAMLITMASFSAMAEGEEPVSLTVTPDIVSDNGVMTVTLDVDETVVGGVEATITYDNQAVKFVSANFSNDVNTQANSVLDNNGSLKVIVLGGNVEFDFAVLNTVAESVSFVATVKASNKEGTGYAYQGTLNVTAPVTKTVKPVMLGTKLRETTNPNDLHLGFTAEIANLGNHTITEVGLIVIPTALLTVAPENLTVSTEKVLKAVFQGDKAAEFTKEEFVGYIKNTASTALMGKSFTARYYIKVDGLDEEIYSTNFTFDSKGETTASYGTAKKSAVKQLGAYAKQIAANTTDETIQAAAAKVISDYNATKSVASKEALIDFVFNNRTLIEK